MHPEAREEFLAAIDYYNEAEPGVGMAFCAEVESAIGLIENYPDLWAEIGGNIFLRKLSLHASPATPGCSSRKPPR